MVGTAITFTGLSLGYGRLRVVTGLNGAVQRGSLTAVIGANGSGKSTLLKTIAGVLRPIAGRFDIAAGLRTAYLPQQSELDRSFPAHVGDLVSLGLWPKRGLIGRHRPEDRRVLEGALAAVGLEAFWKQPIDTLSGGQLQRALFARALVEDADLILLDEPFNAIDAQTVSDLLALIKRWHAEGRTVLTVLHDLDLVIEYFPQALLLAGHSVAWGGTEAVLTPENLGRVSPFAEARSQQMLRPLPSPPRFEQRGAA